jgi:predicted HAD superfamily phosphohydrolase
VRTTAGCGKVACLEQLQARLEIGPDHVIFAGDGSSDVHAMLHVNGQEGLTIAVSETKNVSQVAKRTVISANTLAMLLPLLETIVAWKPAQIRDFFETHGLLVQEWARVRTDWLTLRPAVGQASAQGAE